MLPERPEDFYAERPRIVELNGFGFPRLFFRLARSFAFGRRIRTSVFGVGVTASAASFPYLSFSVFQKQKGAFSDFAALRRLNDFAHALFQDAGPLRLVKTDRQFIDDGARPVVFPVSHLELHRPFFSQGEDVPETSPSFGGACLLDSELEAVGQKTERVEQGAFADSIFADHRGQRGKRRPASSPRAAERRIFQRPEVPYPETFHLRHRSFSPFSGSSDSAGFSKAGLTGDSLPVW